LGARLALDITGHIAAGLAAIHKEHLVHRDIKSSNVMLSQKEPGGYVAKIIDLGLAKAVEELPKEAALSNAKDPQNRPQDPSEVQVTVERTMQALDHRPLFSGLPLPSVLRGNVVILSIVDDWR
jgi:serine/threonine protein kinase